MKLYYNIKMPDESIWRIPVSIIVHNRALTLAGDSPEIGECQKKLDETRELFETDESEIEDWARNSMDWNDVCHVAKCIKSGNVDYQDGWINGESRLSS